MDNKRFKEVLGQVGMTKKGFAEKVGLAYQTVIGWNHQGYPIWIDSYIDVMAELNDYEIQKKSEGVIKGAIQKMADGCEVTVTIRKIEEKI